MRESQWAPIPEPMRGKGYFNSNPGVGAGEAAAIKKARAPFTSVDEQGRELIDITAPGYHDAVLKACEEYAQPQYKSSGNSNSLWTMPYQERDALLHNLSAAGVGSLDDAMNLPPKDKRNSYQEAVAGLDNQTLQDAFEYQAAVRNESGEEIPDTGRYVVLRAPEGTTSKLMMELEPRMDVHRFVDLEMPEGQAQILELKEGAYDVAWEFEGADIIRDGIDAARKFQAEHGIILTTKCGRGDMSVENSDLYKIGHMLDGADKPQPGVEAPSEPYDMIRDREPDRDISPQLDRHGGEPAPDGYDTPRTPDPGSGRSAKAQELFAMRDADRAKEPDRATDASDGMYTPGA